LQRRAAVRTGEKAGFAVDRERLAQAVRELAADLATARRDCRDKQRRIDSLQAEIASLRGRLGSDP
jgi:multidrug resistance efflux pump